MTIFINIKILSISAGVSDRNDDYGYVIDYYDGEKDDDNHKVWKSLTEKDYDYICWDTVEE